MVESPTAQMSFAEDADAAKRPLLDLLPFGVGTTWKIEPAPVCAFAGVPCNMAAANPKNITALSVSFTIPPK
jgi:hypothetical protein